MYMYLLRHLISLALGRKGLIGEQKKVDVGFVFLFANLFVSVFLLFSVHFSIQFYCISPPLLPFYFFFLLSSFSLSLE